MPVRQLWHVSAPLLVTSWTVTCTPVAGAGITATDLPFGAFFSPFLPFAQCAVFVGTGMTLVQPKYGMTEDVLTVTYLESVKKLYFNPHAKDLEQRAVHLLVSLLVRSSNSLLVWDSLRRTGLLAAAARALGSKRRLRELLSVGGKPEEYLKAVELASNSSPYECMRHLCLYDNNYNELESLFGVLGRLSQLGCNSATYRACCDSLARTVSNLLSDARNCALLVRANVSPIRILFSTLRGAPSSALGASLCVLRVILMILLHTTVFTSIWAKEFTDLCGPTTCLSVVLMWFRVCREPTLPLGTESTVLFDLLCLLLSFPGNGCRPSNALYLYLRGCHWETEDGDVEPPVGATEIGMFGLTVLVEASSAAMNCGSQMFAHLARLFIRVLKVGNDDVASAGLVSPSMVVVLRQYVLLYNDWVDAVLAITQLCVTVCTRQEVINLQVEGATQLCTLVVELMTSTKECISRCTIQAVMRLVSHTNAEAVFTRLLSVHLLKKLSERLVISSDPAEVHLFLQVMKSICEHVPFLQGEFLPTVRTIFYLLGTEAQNGREALMLCVDLLTVICVEDGDRILYICAGLRELLTQTDFCSYGSVLRGCWSLQACISILKHVSLSLSYFVTNVGFLTECIGDLCVIMRQASASQEVVAECFGTPSHVLVLQSPSAADFGSDPKGVGQNIYSSHCQFLILALHALCYIQATSTVVSVRVLAEKVERALANGPFLQCPLYTSVVMRALVGLSSLSSFVVFNEVLFENEGVCVHWSLVWGVVRTRLWRLNESTGDTIFAKGRQRIVCPDYFGCLQRLLLQFSDTCQKALLGVSVARLWMDVFSNSAENVYILMANKITLTLANLFSFAVAKGCGSQPEQLRVLLETVHRFGSYGVDCASMLYLLQLCLGDRGGVAMDDDDEATVKVLSTLKALLQESLACNEPMLLYGVSPGFTNSLPFCKNVPDMSRKALHCGGVGIPIHIGRMKSDRCFSFILWFFFEPELLHACESADVVLLSIAFNRNDTLIQVVCTGGGTLYLRLILETNQDRRPHQHHYSRHALFSSDGIPVRRWCMLSLAVSQNRIKSFARNSRYTLNCRVSLYARCCAEGQPSVTMKVSDIRCHEQLKRHQLLREVSMASLAAVDARPRGCPRRFLLGSFGAFGAALSRLEVEMLFVMGSDSLFLFHFMDRRFVNNLFPLLANMSQTSRGKHGDQLVRMSVPWLLQGYAGAEGVILASTSPFSMYQRLERRVVVAGVRDGDLCIESNMGYLDTDSGNPKMHGPELQDAPPPNSGRLVKSGSRVSVPFFLGLCTVANTQHSACQPDSTLALLNAPQFICCSPMYSLLDALGGVPFFLCFSTLQFPRSRGFEEAWECACLAIKLHTTDNLLCCHSQHGDVHLVALIKATLYYRVSVSEQVASSLCDTVGDRLIIRVDLLPLLFEFTVWARDAGAFRVVVHKLRLYVLDDVYGHFNRQILDSGYGIVPVEGECYALEEFLLHLHMHFSRGLDDSWGISLVPFATDFLSSLCRTAAHVRRLVRAAVALLIVDKPLTQTAIEWTVGFLEVVFRSLENGVGVSGDEGEGTIKDVIIIFSSSHETVRCRALTLLSCVPVSRAQMDATIRQYMVRGSLTPGESLLSESEFLTIVGIVERSAAAGDTCQARGFLYLLISLLAHVQNEIRSGILSLLSRITYKVGVFERGLLWPCEIGAFPISLLYGRLVHVLQELEGDCTSLVESFMELLTCLCEGIVSTSWERDDTQCGCILGDVGLAFLVGVGPILKRAGHGGSLSVCSSFALVRAYRFSSAILRAYSLHLDKGPFTAAFLTSYTSFLSSVAVVVVLLSWCERDYRLSDDVKAEDASWAGHALAEAYLAHFLKPMQFGDHHVGVRLCVLFFECAQRLFFQLRTACFVEHGAKRVLQEVLMMQWSVAAALLNDADTSGDDFVKELTLLYVATSGTASYGLKFSTWKEGEKLVEPPLGSDWRHLQLAPGALITELLRVHYGAAVKESAPWLIICRGASSLLGEPRLKMPSRFSMAVSICRLVRYNRGIWSQVKDGFTSSSLVELEANIKTNSKVVGGCVSNSLHEAHKENVSALWEVDFSRSGVATLERYVSDIHSAALSSLNQCTKRFVSPFPSVNPEWALGCQEKSELAIRQYHDSVLQRVTLHRETTEEETKAALAVYAAYRFSLLPWWGQCVSLYTKALVPLNQWELDRFTGPEWQRIRLRRFVHTMRAKHTQDKDKLFSCFCRGNVSYTDDVELLQTHSITAAHQLVGVQRTGPQPFVVKCVLVLPMDRVPVTLYVSPHNISYVQESLGLASEGSGKGSLGMAPSSCVRGRSLSSLSGVHGVVRQQVGAPGCDECVKCPRRVFAVSSLRAVWARRNLLQPSALELLFKTGETVFLVFHSQDTMKLVCDIVTTVACPYLDRTLALTEANLKMWCNWWSEGRITNFHYLMYLNFAAGRSYGDMRQYPVFPHVVADYSSSFLDLSSPSTYRCLERPIGAQTAEGIQRARKTYAETATDSGTDASALCSGSPYHYGSHYSPLGGALHYLIRVQPFSDYFVRMNSKLDDAGRVFDSVAAAYAISTGGKDVKELLPEFYCLPDMFVNSNHISFGMKQDGTVVNDVQLPQWASTPRDLSQKLRGALESCYVSENLHSWIDLIFGFKQRGREAVAALNTFHPLTYEGCVDLSTINDLVLRTSHETQIDYFGQTPLQLFTQPHKPRRRLADGTFPQTPCPTLRYDAPNSALCAVLHPEQLVPAGVCKRGCGTVVSFPRKKLNGVGNCVEEGTERKFQDNQPRHVVLPKGVLPFTVVHDQIKDCLCHRGNNIVMVDGRDPSQQMYSFVVGRGKITVLAVDSPTVYAGMESGAIHVVAITHNNIQGVELSFRNGSGAPVGGVETLESFLQGKLKLTQCRQAVCRTLCVLYGHTARVTALCLSTEWGILVSSSEDCNVALWDIERRVLVRTIHNPLQSLGCFKFPVTSAMGSWLHGDSDFWHFDVIAVNAKHGDIVLAGGLRNGLHEVRRYSINGEFLSSYSLGGSRAAALLSVGEVAFVAKGMAVHILKGRSLEWSGVLTHPGIESLIESLALSPNGHRLVACDQRENVVTWNVASP